MLYGKQKQSVLTVSGVGDDFVALVFGQAVLVDEALGERLEVRHLLSGWPTRYCWESHTKVVEQPSRVNECIS